jgi:hypothetical protein
MSVRRQWEIFISSWVLGFFAYALIKAGTPIPPWVCGVGVAAAIWGVGFNIEKTRTHQSQVLSELREIRAALDISHSKEL